MKKSLGYRLAIILFLSSMIVSLFSCSGSAADRPEVTLFAYDSGGVRLNMIFDLKNSGLLCDKSAKTEILKAPSEENNPWTYFDHEGNFGIVVSQEKDKVTNSTDYGRYFYATVGSGNEQRTIAAFKRRGDGEKAIGCASGDIWIADKGKEKKIGQMVYENYISPEGEERTGLFSRITAGKSPWVIQLGDKIYTKADKDKKLTQVGWVGWRKITANDGKQMVILMTKGMSKNSKWAGRYDGKLYVEK